MKNTFFSVGLEEEYLVVNKYNGELIVEPPKGFETWEWIKGKRVSKLLYLKRALYGTKQASRLWQETLCKHLALESKHPTF